MEYRYKKNQIFRKKLDLPKYVLNNVYDSNLTFSEYIKYGLDSKIPISCIIPSERVIIERFGIEKCKTLDWELIKAIGISDFSIKDVLMSIDPEVKDLNGKLYELVKDRIRPSDYSTRMKDVYFDRLFEMPKDYVYDRFGSLKYAFNDGECTLEQMITYWKLFEDKDLSLCLKNDEQNSYDLTNNDVKKFMSEIGLLIPYMTHEVDIYTLIGEYNKLESAEEKHNYIKDFTDKILRKTYRERIDEGPLLKLSDAVYKQIFKYSSMEDYLMIFDRYEVPKIMEELKTLPEGYLFDCPIPFHILSNFDVLEFIGEFGLKNIVDFDNECGHFFTSNDCEMLKLMNDMYLHYAGNEHDINRNIYQPKIDVYDDDGNFVKGYYTKDGFYESMRRMIVYGPSDWNYSNKAPDYRNVTGEFRVRNFDLFISEQAPVELKKLFYTKSITPGILAEHLDYIPFLDRKDLSSCFKNREISIEGSHRYENFYSFLSSKVSFNEMMEFITEYSDVLDVVFSRENSNFYRYEVTYSTDDSITDIKAKTEEIFSKILKATDIVYPNKIPDSLKENCFKLFISDAAPEKLKDAFYNRKITTELILSDSRYAKFLKNLDIEVVFKNMPVVVKYGSSGRYVNLISMIREIFGEEDAFDVMLLYGKTLEKIYKIDKFRNLQLDFSFSKDNMLDAFDNVIYKTIVDGRMKYDDGLSSHFKTNYPMLFLDESVSKDIKDKFYNREFTLSDFEEEPELIDIFNKTNIVCGFPENLSWIISLFTDEDNHKLANYNRLKVISEFMKIEDVVLQESFKEFILMTDENINMEKLEYTAELLRRLSLSNSSEILNFRKVLATQLLKSDHPLKKLSEIEDIFVKSHIPTVGKVYACFEILHPNFEGFDFDNYNISPILSEASLEEKKVLVFADLIKASFGSNNRSINSYLENIETGSKLYSDIRDGKIIFDELDEESKNQLIVFSKYLATLYNNAGIAQIRGEVFALTGNVLDDLLILSEKLSPDGSVDYNLADRVVSLFCGFIGVNTLDDAKRYINDKRDSADRRNRIASNSDMELKEGDFIKGIGGITYLRSILQNGSVAREFLGASAYSDSTPLDTDLSRIMSSDKSISEKIDDTAAHDYGPIWFVLKNDDRFITTRTEEGLTNSDYVQNKLEVFFTGALGTGHYGLRTGFASSEINYIVMDEYDPRVGLEIAMNGFYIPIANKEGKIIFTPDDYDIIREKMSGLSYYRENDYVFSSNLVTEETSAIALEIEQSNNEVNEKKKMINAIIKEVLEEMGLKLKTEIDGDLTEGYVELIDTGSTGRGTNKLGDGDFDLMMRLDRTILHNPKRLSELKTRLLKKLGRDNSEGVIGTGDFRLKDVSLDESTLVDIDITFTEKTDKVLYSTDMALKDRLETIKKQDPEKYNLVVANILLAKEVLKEAGVYKPNRGEVPQGGLGGVGVENWILQNGGSFIDAARSFVEDSEGKTFEEFKKSYQIWDFGDNHLAERRNQYVHDNFVTNNMSEEGYHKMRIALSNYLKKAETAHVDTGKKVM